MHTGNISVSCPLVPRLSTSNTQISPAWSRAIPLEVAYPKASEASCPSDLDSWLLENCSCFFCWLYSERSFLLSFVCASQSHFDFLTVPAYYGHDCSDDFLLVCQTADVSYLQRSQRPKGPHCGVFFERVLNNFAKLLELTSS